jgi:hypothetical protein
MGGGNDSCIKAFRGTHSKPPGGCFREAKCLFPQCGIGKSPQFQKRISTAVINLTAAAKYKPTNYAEVFGQVGPLSPGAKIG